MITGPSGEAAAAGHGRLRASHADREQVIDVLKAAFVQGRLTKDELDARLAQVLASRTYAELAAVTADLPVGLIAARLAARPARAPASRAVKSGLSMISVAATLTASAWTAAWLTGSTGLFALAMTITIAAFGSVLLAAAVMLESRHDQRSSGQLPPRPGGGGRTSRRPAPAGPAGPFPQIGQDQYTAQTARTLLPRPQLTGY